MIQINLINTKIKEESDDKIIYQPKKYSEELNYKITIKSKIPYLVQFIIYANFINSIEFINVNSKQIIGDNSDNYNNVNKYEYLSNQGIIMSCVIKENSYLTINYKPIDLCTNIILKKVNPIKINNLKNLQWDNIFIINLLRRNDRRIQMENKLYQANITKYEFIEAFDGLDNNISNDFLKIKKTSKNPIVTSGHYACLLSHIKAIEIAKNRNYSNIIILEDDVFFCENFLNKLSNIMLPDYDMIYLGGITSKKKLFLSDWAYCDKLKIMGAYGYILSNKIFDDILTKLKELQDYVDLLYIKQIQPNYKVLILNDFIKTDLSSSDTSNKSKKMIKRLNYIK